MASIGDLPPVVLTRIFSRFRPFEWLLLETVCRRWRHVVVSQLWNRLRCVDEEGIAFPCGDFAWNFIEIAKRIRSVTRFVNPLGLVSHSQSVYDDRHHHMKEPVVTQLKAAVVELVAKRSPDAVFPLDLIGDLYERNRGSFNVNSVGSFLETAMAQYRVAEFSSIRLDKVALHEHSPDPFSIATYRDEIPLPLERARVSRIVVGVLVVCLTSHIRDAKEALGEIAAWRTRFSSFPNLQHVEIESVQLVMPSRFEKTLRHMAPWNEPQLSARISLAEGGCVLAVAEMDALLGRLASVDEYDRNREFLEKIRRWKDDRVVTGVAMRIHSDKFMMVEEVGMAGRGSGAPSVTGYDDSLLHGDESVKSIVAELLPGLVDRLHLTISTLYEEGDYFVGVLRGRGVLARLKEYSVIYVEPLRNRFDDDPPPKHDSKLFLTEAYKVIQPVCDQMDKLEVLRLNLQDGGNLCSFPKVDNVPVVKRTLPLLQLVEIDGFPCLPFLSSVVQHAVNLKQLVVNSQPFSSDQTGLQRVIKFLESMQGGPRLTYLSLKAWNSEDMIFMGTGRIRRRPRSEKLESKIKPMLAEMESHLVRLGNTMPNLVYVAATIGRCQYKYEMDRRRQ